MDISCCCFGFEWKTQCFNNANVTIGLCGCHKCDVHTCDLFTLSISISGKMICSVIPIDSCLHHQNFIVDSLKSLTLGKEMLPNAPEFIHPVVAQSNPLYRWSYPSLNFKVGYRFGCLVGTAFCPAMVVISDKAESMSFLSWVAAPTPWLRHIFNNFGTCIEDLY